MFEAVIVSPQFAGKPSLARHRLANSALAEEIKQVHAWSQKLFTPEEWERKKGQQQ
jgi:stress-induced morphogen